MSCRDISMDTIMEEDESFASNANATIYGASYISGRTESLISGPNILSSSSTSEDDCHPQQISTASDNTSDDLIVSSSASSNLFTNNNKQGEVRIFNVDFRALLSISHTQSQNQFGQAQHSSFRRYISDNYSNIPGRNRRQSMLNKSLIALSRKLYHAMVPEQIRINQFQFHPTVSIIRPTPIRTWIYPSGSPLIQADDLLEVLHRVSGENKKLAEMLTVLCKNYNSLRNHVTEHLSITGSELDHDQKSDRSKKRKVENKNDNEIVKPSESSSSDENTLKLRLLTV